MLLHNFRVEHIRAALLFRLFTGLRRQSRRQRFDAYRWTRQIGREHVAYASERKAFGRPIGSFQVWKHKLVEHLTSIEAARRLTYHACDLFNRREEATKEITMAKLFAGDLLQRVVYDCQQLYGGWGYIEEFSIARAYRDVRLVTIGGGTSEIMKEILTKLTLPGTR